MIEVNPYATSVTCSACGHRNPKNRDSQADFRYRAYRHKDNADANRVYPLHHRLGHPPSLGFVEECAPTRGGAPVGGPGA